MATLQKLKLLDEQEQRYKRTGKVDEQAIRQAGITQLDYQQYEASKREYQKTGQVDFSRYTSDPTRGIYGGVDTSQLDKDALNLVRTAWKDKYSSAVDKGFAYDMTDPEDYQNMLSGRMSKAASSAYDVDEMSQWLYREGLPNSQYFGAYYNTALEEVQNYRRMAENDKALDERVQAALMEKANAGALIDEITVAETLAEIRQLDAQSYDELDKVLYKDAGGVTSKTAQYLAAHQEVIGSLAPKEEPQKQLFTAGEMWIPQRDRVSEPEAADPELSPRAEEAAAILAPFALPRFEPSSREYVRASENPELHAELAAQREADKQAYAANVEFLSNGAYNALIESGFSDYEAAAFMDMNGIPFFGTTKHAEAEAVRRANQSEGLAYLNQRAVEDGMENAATFLHSYIAPIDRGEWSDAQTEAIYSWTLGMRQELIEQGYTPLEADNIIAVSDLGEALDKRQTAEDYERHMLSLYGLDELAINDYISTLTDEDWEQRIKDLKFNDTIETGSFEQAERTLYSIPVRAALGIATGVVGVADMALNGLEALATGQEQDMWKSTKYLLDQSGRWAAYGRDINHPVMSAASDIGSEILRMYALGAAGKALGGLTAAGTSTLLTTAASQTPFVASAMGSYYTQARMTGANQAEATLYGVIGGTVEGLLEGAAMSEILEQAFTNKIMTKAITNAATPLKTRMLLAKYGTPLANILASTIGEFGEEAASEVVSGLLRTALWEPAHETTLADVGESGAMGAAIGFIMSALGAPATSRRNQMVMQMMAMQSGIMPMDLQMFGEMYDNLVAATITESLKPETLTLVQKDAALQSAPTVADMIAQIQQDNAHISAESVRHKRRLEALTEDVEKARSKVNRYVTAFKALDPNSPDYATRWGELRGQIDSARDNFEQITASSLSKREAAAEEHAALVSRLQNDVARTSDKLTRHFVARDAAVQAETEAIREAENTGVDGFGNPIQYELPDDMKEALAAKYITPEIAERIAAMEAIPVTMNDMSPERQQYRIDKIKEYRNTYRATKQERQAYLILGPPASGKSTLADPLVQRTGSILIDSDIMMTGDKKTGFQGIPEYGDGIGTIAAHDESTVMADGVFDLSIANGDNIVYPKVGWNADSIRDIAVLLRANGYTTNLILNELPIEKAMERNNNRYHEDGRLVIPKHLLHVGNKPIRTFLELQQEGAFDSYERYSNDVERGHPPVAILENGVGRDGVLRHGRSGGRDTSSTGGTVRPAEGPGGGMAEEAGGSAAPGGIQDLGANTPDAPIEYAVSPQFRETATGLRRLGRRGYRAFVDGSAELGNVTKAQKQAQSGTATVDAMAQIYRNAGGTVDYMLDVAQVDAYGNPTGQKSYRELWESYPDVDGETANLYLLHRHNIDRMAQEKPIFANEDGTPVTAEQSREIIKQMAQENPDLPQLANEVRQWHNRFMRDFVVGDLLSESDFANLLNMYPDYVPTFRKEYEDKPRGTSSSRGTTVSINQPIRTAKGATSDVRDVRDSFADGYNAMVRARRKNDLLLNLYQFALDHPSAAAPYAQIVGNPVQDSAMPVYDDIMAEAFLEARDGDYIVRARKNGEWVEMGVSKDVFDSINDLFNRQYNEFTEDAMGIGRKITGWQKALITGYNPFFAVRNLARDTQTALFNDESMNPIKFVDSLAKSAKMMAENSPEFQKFKALGGDRSGFFKSNEGFVRSAKFDTPDTLGKKALNKLGDITAAGGEYTETLNRFATAIRYIDKHGSTDADWQQAMLASAEGTTNFSRSGPLAKAADSWLIYLNANIQGTDKVLRQVKNHPASTLSKTAGVALAASLLGHLAGNDENEHYHNLSWRVKDNYFCIPNVFGERDSLGYPTTFIRIPKAQGYAAIIAAFQRAATMVTQDKDFIEAYDGFIDSAQEALSITPSTPVSALIEASRNESWSGATIEPAYMGDRPVAERYDSSTSSIAVNLGKVLAGMGASPKKIDYVLDQWTGVAGDIVLPATAIGNDSAESAAKSVGDVLARQFVADPLFSNDIVSNFYEAGADIEIERRQAYDARTAAMQGDEFKGRAELKFTAYNKAKGELSESYKRERDILAKHPNSKDRDQWIKDERRKRLRIIQAFNERWGE